jgi:outer membrane protein assembly factor BamB
VLQLIVIANGPPPSATPTPSPTKTKVTATPTLTPRASASPTCVPTTAPLATPTIVQFNAIGTFNKTNGKKPTFEDITTEPSTAWFSSNPNVLQPPLPGPQGGNYMPQAAGCVCISASNSQISSQSVAVGVGPNCFDNCPAQCSGVTPTATMTPTPLPPGAPAASSTPAVSARSAGVLMWTFDPGAELRGRIATGPGDSIFFTTRDGVLHGLNSSGKEIMHRSADGSSPAVLADGTVLAMSSRSQLAAISPGGAILWHLEIGASEGPLTVGDSAIYASVGGDLVSISTAGSLNWRVNVGPVRTAATTADGVVVGTARGAVTALASDGGVLWTFQPDGGFSGAIAYADDVVYAGSAGGGVYAIDSRTGNPLWHVNAAHAVTAGPAVAPSGTIFAGGDTVYGVSSDGQLRWQDPTLKPGAAGLCVLGNDGVFDAATGDVGTVLTGDGSYVWAARGFGKITTAASSPSGILYVGASTGRIFAVK